MSAPKISATPAIRRLKAEGAPFTLHPYDYEDKGGTATASAALGIPEHRVIKTLVMEADSGKPLIVLMHGDRQVSLKSLARQIGAKTVQPCPAQKAEKVTGYSVGGISPLGTRQTVPVYMEATIADLPEIYINAGKRGLLFSMITQDLIRILHPVTVTVAI